MPGELLAGRRWSFVRSDYRRNPLFWRVLHKYYKADAELLLSSYADFCENHLWGERRMGDTISETVSMSGHDAGMGKNDATRDGFNWVTGIAMLLFHLGAVAALFFFTWKAFFVACLLWWISGSWGIGMAYHRLLTHRGYKTPKWVEYVLTWCATLALEGGPIFWVATHRIHHQFSDVEGDPHSPNDGKWWSHMGWILTGRSMHHDTTTLARYVPDLTKDKVHVWMTKYHWTSNVIVGVILLAIGGLPWLLWGVFARVVVGLHSTWAVNSITHMWGTRRFATRDLSTNNFLVALFTFGEGWHNNHHAHPVSARHGLAWWEIDTNWYGIWLLKKVGLARHVYKISLDQLPPKPALVRDLEAAELVAPAAAGND